MADEEVLRLDALGQADLVRSGAISSVELIGMSIAASERLDGQIGALVSERFEKARVEAEGVDLAAPLAGVPMLLKDLIAHTAGDPFHEAITGVVKRGHIEEHDTEIVDRFRRAGLVIVGKTKCSELGILPTAEPAAFPPARNPWDTSRMTMGSSGGSAAAVAAGLVSIAHGNDLGGSLRSPASACGIVGMKPSRGLIPLGPDFGDLMSGLVTEFVMTRTVLDAAACLDALSGPMPGDPYNVASPTDSYASHAARPPRRLRVGLLPGAAPAIDDSCREAVLATGRALEAAGHAVEVSHPVAYGEFDFSLEMLNVVSSYAEFALDHWGRRLGEPLGEHDVEPLTWWLAELSRQRTPGSYLSTVEWLQAWSRRVAQWWAGGFDLLVTPTMSSPPPPLGYLAVDPANPLDAMMRVGALTPYTMTCNVTGSPAISLPLDMSPEGLPIGVQLVACPGDDANLLATARQLELAVPWSHRHPAVSVF